MNRWVVVTALLGASGVVLGAFGAHGLESRLTSDQLDSWKTAVQYHLFHALALLVLIALARQGATITLPASLFTAGVVLFSGSIYGLLLTDWRWLGPVTPLGGLCLIAGWLALLALARD